MSYFINKSFLAFRVRFNKTSNWLIYNLTTVPRIINQTEAFLIWLTLNYNS